ncbi:molybdopterin-dependent oxidoreductase, partial [Solihabitans fulvus]
MATPAHTTAGQATPTHCPYCALQCGMSVSRELEVSPRDFPTSRGGLCQKGWTSAEVLSSPGRLTTPLLRERRDEPLRPVSWDVALDFVAGRLARLRVEHGPDSVAVFGGGGLTNEKAYVLGKFARVALGTAQIDYN